MDRDAEILLPKYEALWQGRNCVSGEVSKETLPATDKSGVFLAAMTLQFEVNEQNPNSVVRLCWGVVKAESTFQPDPFPLVQENGKCLNVAKYHSGGSAEGSFVNAHGSRKDNMA